MAACWSQVPFKAEQNHVPTFLYTRRIRGFAQKWGEIPLRKAAIRPFHLFFFFLILI